MSPALNKTALWAFLLTIFLSGMRTIYQDLLPGPVNTLLILIVLVPPVLGWALVWGYAGGVDHMRSPGWRGYPLVMAMFFVALTCYGAVRGNYYKLIVLDAIPYIVFLQGFYLSVSRKFWEDMVLPTIILSSIALLVGFTNTSTEVSRNRALIVEQRGYRAQNLFYLLPLVYLYCSFVNMRRAHVAMSALLMGVVAFQLVFLKRAPLVYYLAVIVLSLLVVSVRRQAFAVATWLAGAVLAALLAIVALPLDAIFDNLEKRFIGAKGEGVMEVVTYENERLTELYIMWDDMSLGEKVFGRGMGGVISGAALETSGFNTYESDEGVELGKESTHVGYGTYVLKGGLLLLAFMTAPMLMLLLRLPMLGSLDPRARAASLFMLVQALSFLIEGTPSVSSLYLALSLGLAIGALTIISGSSHLPAGARR